MLRDKLASGHAIPPARVDACAKNRCPLPRHLSRPRQSAGSGSRKTRDASHANWSAVCVRVTVYLRQ